VIPYFSYESSDNSHINVEVFQTMESIPMHRHEFQEFVLITKGSCMHRFKDISMPLIPGDVFVVPPHREHAYIVETPVCMYNCQFYPAQLAEWWDEQFGELLDKLTESEQDNSISPANLNQQNIIHLSVAEAGKVKAMLDSMHHEQQVQEYAYDQVKQDYLNLILIIIDRAGMHQYAVVPRGENHRRKIVEGAQKYIESHLTENIDFSYYIRSLNYSPGYFRSIFKAETGLSLIGYLNRLRVVHAIEFLKNDSLSVSEVAATVGILDANYFSRLFRKMIGYSPSEFRGKLERFSG